MRPVARPNELDERFVRRVQQVREFRGLSRPQLAALAGMTYRAVRDIEIGERYVRLFEAIALADALGVPLLALAGEAPFELAHDGDWQVIR